MAKLALINNFDEAVGGPSKRTARFLKWFSDLHVIGRDALQTDESRRQFYADYDGFVLSGSPHNVTDIEKPEERWMKAQEAFVRDCPKPVLGTCFGHQLLCHAFGARVDWIRPDVPRKNNAIAKMRLEKTVELFPGMAAGTVFSVEQSHNQEVVAGSLPRELENVAAPEARWQAENAAVKESAVQLVRHRRRMVFGTQFHPETFEGADVGAEKTGAALLSEFEAVCARR